MKVQKVANQKQEDQGGDVLSNGAYEQYVSNGKTSQRRDSPLII